MMAVDAARLLGIADRILSGELALPRGTAVRIAAVLARSVLEDLVVDECGARGVDVSETSMRVKLATLTALSVPKAGELAMIWWTLSRACHQHAYEIAPSAGEIARLVASIRDYIQGRRAVGLGVGDQPQR